MSNKPGISLKDVGKELPFTVPDHYFEDFANRMVAQTQRRRVPLRRMMKPWLYLAALFAGVVLMAAVANAIYQYRINVKMERYEYYLLSQVDQMTIIDFYYDNLTETQTD